MKYCKASERMRHLNCFFQLIECLSDKAGADGPTLPRKKNAPKRYEIGEGEGYHSPTVSDHYRQLYFEAIDLVTSGINNRFDQPGCAIYQNLEGLLLKAANKEDYSSEFTEVTMFYGSDIDNSELTSQLLIFATKFATECPAGKKITLVDILSFLWSLSEGQRTFFCQVCTIARLLILSSTNAVYETIKELFKKHYGPSKAKPSHAAQYLQRPA